MKSAENALITGIFLTLIFGVIAYLLKRVIWNSKNKVTSTIESGKKFASYAVMGAAFSGGFLFLKKEIVEAIVSFLFIMVAYGVFGFLIGFLYYAIVKQKKWNYLIWTGLITLIFFFIDSDNSGDDMHFSVKFAILYILAGFVASGYYLKEGEQAKRIPVIGFIVCFCYTLATYGIEYAVITGIEFAIGYGLATFVIKKKIITENNDNE